MVPFADSRSMMNGLSFPVVVSSQSGWFHDTIARKGADGLCKRLGVAKLVPFDDLTELQDGVLLRRRGVIDGDVGHLCERTPLHCRRE